MWPMLMVMALALLMAFSNILLYVVDRKNKLSLVVGVGTIIAVLVTLYHLFKNHPELFH